MNPRPPATAPVDSRAGRGLLPHEVTVILHPQPLPSVPTVIAARRNMTRRSFKAWIAAREVAADEWYALTDEEQAALTAPKLARQPVPHPDGPRSVRRRRAAGLVLP